MNIIHNLVDEISNNNYSISDILYLQHKYHEERRWSIYELIGDRSFESITNRDRAALWHVARAEITTQPAGIRLATDGVKLANELAETNPLGSKIAHIAAAWSGRYWLEEEAHHEVAYGILLEMAGVAPIEPQEVVDHRGFFPSDNYVRVCMLQACVEIEASVIYGEMAKTSTDPLIRDAFEYIMRDEVQHRTYFISFAKALIDAKVYPVKDVLSIAYTWIRPDVGETHGSSREAQSERKGFVNWWERLKTDDSDDLTMKDDQLRTEQLQQKKIRSVLSAVYQATGINVTSINDLEKAYYASLRTSNVDRIRSSIHHGDKTEASAA